MILHLKIYKKPQIKSNHEFLWVPGHKRGAKQVDKVNTASAREKVHALVLASDVLVGGASLAHEHNMKDE